MNSFVQQVVKYLDDNKMLHPETTIIVPSQRMIAYVHKAMYELAGKPIISPKISTIDRWIQGIVPLPIIEKTHLLFELYEIYRKNPIEDGVNGFDAFLSWGKTLLSDFDEIDRYLIESDQLFKNLKSIREIENWSFNSGELSLGQQKFMAFWDKLNPYYTELNTRLITKGFTTKAKAYKFVAENIDLVFKENNRAQFVFAGFNALSEAEIQVMRQLHQMGRGHILMDSDTFYLNDKLHEAGQFQRVLLDRLGVKELPFIADNLLTKSMQVTLVECPQFTSQAQAIGHELTKIPLNDLPETLVLLASEQLLSSLLQNLPAQIGQANITLGLPLQQTVLKSWIELIFRIQESFIRRKSGIVHYKDFIQFIHHPFTEQAISPEERHELNVFEQKMVNRNWQIVFLDKLPKGKHIDQLYEGLFLPWNNDWNIALNQMQSLNFFLDAHLPETANLEQAIVRKFGEAVQEVIGLFETEIPTFSLATFKQLFQQQWANDSIAYYGNPLDGLQIMGLLETRGIDFKHVFVLGMNEGEMPPTNPINTLIPMDLRRYFGLPTPREKQGLFAHHFYRLLHQCESLFITYTSSQEAVGSNEPSRYVQQIKLELARLNKSIHVEEKFMGIPTKVLKDKISISKVPAHLETLDELVTKGITFSQMDKYLTCSLNYFHQYILKFKENTVLEEELEASTKGTILHHVMENLYKPYVSTPENPIYITPDLIRELEKKVPLFLDEAFKEAYSDDMNNVNTGINHIFYVVSRDIILNWLRKERRLLEKYPDKALQILSLEEEFVVDIKPLVNGVEKTIRLKGIIDRLDKWGDEIRILDYKSGKVESDNVKLTNKGKKSMSDLAADIVKQRQKNTGKDYSLQLMIYSYLYYKFSGTFTNQSGIISFNNISGSPFILNNEAEIGKNELLELVEHILGQVLGEMYDMDLPFEHNPKSKYCKYCDSSSS